jgi:AcrR family transcriptional regulator
MSEALPLRDSKRLRTQQVLYDTAVELIAEHGYDHVTVEDICDAAAVARATFFRYFGTKAGLMLEFDRRIARDIEATLARQTLDTVQQLEVVQAAMASAWSKSHPNLRALGLDYLRSTAVSEMGVAVAGIRDVTARIIQSGYDDGTLRPVLPAKLAADLFVSNVRSAIYAGVTRRRRSGAAMHPVVDLFLNGIGTR